MIKVKKVLSVIIASALFVGVLGGCAKKEESSSNGETLKVRYAAYQGMTAVGFWFGVEKGFFRCWNRFRTCRCKRQGFGYSIRFYRYGRFKYFSSYNSSKYRSPIKVSILNV
jgi:hypothetical protein